MLKQKYTYRKDMNTCKTSESKEEKNLSVQSDKNK